MALADPVFLTLCISLTSTLVLARNLAVVCEKFS